MHNLDTIYRRLYLGINYRLRTFAGGRYAKSCRPTSIAITLTERCNARCIHCDIWKNRGVENSPNIDQWKVVLDDLRRWLGPVAVVITGGEALMKRYALDLVEHGSRIGLFIELLSNGFWNDQSKFERLALANPGRVTFSLDGIGEAHNVIRGRTNFFDKTTQSIDTLNRTRKEHQLDFTIRLKTVVMDQNLGDLCKVAEYADQNKFEVFYQPIEQNYNTVEDPHWFEKSDTWPKDITQAVRAVEELIQLKERGLPIVNSRDQLTAMIRYFQEPATWRLAVQSHSAHETRTLCSAIDMLQIHADGSVTICNAERAIGNIVDKPIRQIWDERPHWWEQGCCLERRQNI